MFAVVADRRSGRRGRRRRVTDRSLACGRIIRVRHAPVWTRLKGLRPAYIVFGFGQSNARFVSIEQESNYRC